jgi:hypothetical protein
VSDERSEAALAHAAELEERDGALATEIEALAGLAERADAIRAHARELHGFFESVPGEREALLRLEDEARRLLAAARVELERAEAQLAGLEAKRRARAEEKDQARRELTRAREGLSDAEARLLRAGKRRQELADDERSARARAEGLAVEAGGVARELGEAPRISRAGRELPGATLTELAAWGDRAHAALFVARSSLVAERDRVVREAAELASAVLGEPLGGASVALARRRIEEALADS